MRWSKLKQLVEARFADSVAGRVAVHATRYRAAADRDGRGWLTIDGHEVAAFCTFRALAEHAELAGALRAAQGTTDYTDPAQEAGYYATAEAATAPLQRAGIISQQEFYDALWTSLSLSIDEAIRSEHIPIRALAVLDRRLGKRRLRALAITDADHPIVWQCFKLRCEAEGIAVSPTSAPST